MPRGLTRRSPAGKAGCGRNGEKACDFNACLAAPGLAQSLPAGVNQSSLCRD
jgi:hypothetical protein